MLCGSVHAGMCGDTPKGKKPRTRTPKIEGRHIDRVIVDEVAGIETPARPKRPRATVKRSRPWGDTDTPATIEQPVASTTDTVEPPSVAPTFAQAQDATELADMAHAIVALEPLLHPSETKRAVKARAYLER
jgi:hypothetical protein